MKANLVAKKLAAFPEAKHDENAWRRAAQFRFSSASENSRPSEKSISASRGSQSRRQDQAEVRLARMTAEINVVATAV